MPIRTLPQSSAWTGDFVGALETQYELLGMGAPRVSHSIGEARARPELLLYFGEQRWVAEPALQAELAAYAGSALHLLPVIEQATHASTHLPREVGAFNAFLRGRHGRLWTEALVDEVLALTWQRRSKRRIFISYRRSDGEAVARQLYERYSKLSFDVFLDDVSIQRGVDFQTELRRWIDDADAVLLLISPDVASSRWVREEIELANTRRIGLLGLVWPRARFGAAGEPAAAVQVPLDRQLRLEPRAAAVTSGGPAVEGPSEVLTGSTEQPGRQQLAPDILPDVDHLLFTGRSQAIASRLRDLVDVARSELEADFELNAVSPDGDILLTHRREAAPWFARVVPFRPDIGDLWTWWQEQRQMSTPPAGIIIVYPELDDGDPRSVALRELCTAWGAGVSPSLRLCPARV
jgi:hypothetical protein